MGNTIMIAASIILALATIALAGVTFILVVITFLYMLFTGKMANRMKEQTDILRRELNLRVTPVPAYGITFSQSNGRKISINYVVTNGGLSAFFLENIVIEFFHEDYLGKKHIERISINNYIFPKEEEKSHPESLTTFDYAEFSEFSGVNNLEGKAYIKFYIEIYDIEFEYHRFPEEGKEVVVRIMEKLP